MTLKHYALKIVIVIFCLFCVFTMSGCKNKKYNGLELISFNLKDVSTTRKLAIYETSSDSYDSYFEPYDNVMNIEAIVKNNNRDSFIDIVLYISFLDTYVVYNEGNGEYTCSSTTVYENDLWVTKINLEVQLYKCSDLYGEISVSEINFLHNGSSNEQVDLSKTEKKNISFHRHLYNQEKIQDEYLASEANHYNTAKYYYSCECGAHSYRTFQSGSIIEHTFDQQVISYEYLKEYADCNHGDLYYYSCSCGQKSNEYFEVGEVKHTFASYDNYEYNIYNEDETLTDCGTITRKCTRCSYQYIEKVKGNGGTPTLVYENIDDNTCMVKGVLDSSKRTKIIVPESYNEKKVIKIDSKAFSNCSSLTSITIPFVGSTLNGEYDTHFGYIFGASSYSDNSSYVPTLLKEVIITGGNSIGSHTFYKCSSLTSITIPDSVTSIESYAFYKCSSLTSIIIGDGVTSIGEYAFGYCGSLTSVYYNSIIEDWCNIKFSYSSNPMEYTEHFYMLNKNNEWYELTEIEVPNTITKIGDYQFDGFNSLTKLIIPDSVTSIGAYAFYDCSSLASITIPDSVTSIGSHTFYKCSSLTSITIPDSVTSIESYAFYDCSSLTSIVIPDSVTSIGSSAFSWCSSLTSITIPDSVTSIGYGAFSSCSSLTSITIPDSVTYMENFVFSNNKKDFVIFCKSKDLPNNWSSSWNAYHENNDIEYFEFILDYSDEYSVILNYNHNNLSKDTYIIGYGEKYQLPIPEREGYNFVGWQYENIIIPESGTWITNDSSCELKAIWTNRFEFFYEDGLKKCYYGQSPQILVEDTDLIKNLELLSEESLIKSSITHWCRDCKVSSTYNSINAWFGCYDSEKYLYSYNGKHYLKIIYSIYSAVYRLNGSSHIKVYSTPSVISGWYEFAPHKWIVAPISSDGFCLFSDSIVCKLIDDKSFYYDIMFSEYEKRVTGDFLQLSLDEAQSKYMSAKILKAEEYFNWGNDWATSTSGPRKQYGVFMYPTYYSYTVFNSFEPEMVYSANYRPYIKFYY